MSTCQRISSLGAEKVNPSSPHWEGLRTWTGIPIGSGEKPGSVIGWDRHLIGPDTHINSCYTKPLLNTVSLVSISLGCYVTACVY